MKNMSLLLLSLAMIFQFGCARKLNSKSKVIIQTPASSKVSAKSVLCFAVNVTGPNIAPVQNACSPLIGQHSDFVAAGGVLEFEVDSGPQREIQLYVHTVADGTACPTWDASFDSPANSKTNFSQTFKVDSTVIDLPPGEVNVSLANNTPTSSLISEAPSCSAQGVQAKLFSNGTIVNANNQPFIPNFSNPTNLGMTKHDEDQTSGAAISTATGGLFADLEGLPVQLPPHIHGASQKPDTKEFFASLADGTIVKLDTNTGGLVDLTGACPLTTCKIPVWMESFSVGYGQDIFGKDHSGKIWKINSETQVTDTGDKVEEFVSQVVYY